MPPTPALDRQPVLSTDLLHLRPLREEDHDALFAVSSDPLLWEQHPAKERSQPDGFRAWMDAAVASGGALVVIDRAEDRIIGTSRYEDYDPVAREVEIGWTFIARSHWGGRTNGELKRLMIDHAFGSVDSIIFRVHEHNLRSQAAVKKLGAVLEGTRPTPGGLGDTLVFRLTREVWARR